MKWIKDRIIWLVPITIILVALSIMFVQTIILVSDAPSENWSRSLEVGKAKINRTPLVIEEDNKINMYFYEDEKQMIKHKVFDTNFKQLSSSTISVPFTAWEEYFIGSDNSIYYFQKGTIYKGEKEIAKADHFYPQEKAEKIIFTKDNTVYSLDVKTDKVNTLFETAQPFKGLVVGNSTGDSILVYQEANKEVSTTIYQRKGNSYNKVYQNKSDYPINQFFQELTFANQNDNFAIAYTTKGSQRGKGEIRLFVLQSNFETPNGEFKQIEPLDPKTSSPLAEMGEIKAEYINNDFSLLFKAYGYSYKDTQTQYAFNIYQLTGNLADFSVYRRSNTYPLSTSPFRINPTTIGWVELHGTQNDVLVSSSNPALIDKTTHINFTDFILTIGVILTKISTSTFTLYLTYPWFVTVIIFFMLLFYLKRKSLDNDSPWMTNVGILIYIVTAILLKSHFFVHTIYEQAPKYLTFTGSSIFYILFFGIIAYFSTKALDKEHGATFRVSYFIGLHLLMLMMFFGPYIY